MSLSLSLALKHPPHAYNQVELARQLVLRRRHQHNKRKTVQKRHNTRRNQKIALRFEVAAPASPIAPSGNQGKRENRKEL